MAARKTDSLKKGRSKTNDERRQAKCPASTLPHDDVEVVYRSQQPHNANYHSHCSSTSSSATLGHSPHINIKKIPRNRRLTELREQQSPTNQEYPIHWLSSPELCHFLENDSSECSRRESPKEEEGMSKKDEDQKLDLGTIEEMTDSQLTERAIAAEKAMAAVMLESSSTMVSSLERSLEMAVTHSDGLSDREMKLREAKTTFKLTHRRTASNPTNYPCIQQQKSTDGSTSSAGIDQKHQTTHQEEDCDDESSSAESEENEGSQGGATNEDFQQICSKIAF